MSARPSVRALLMCSAATTLIATPLAAQDSADAAAIELAPITVQSKREVQTDTANSVTVVDLEEIRDRQASTVAELVESAPGVSVYGARTPLSSGINIRGYGPNGSYGGSSHIGVTIGGATKGADELYRMSTQMFTDPALFREVAVTRGLAGTLSFGSGLFGGLLEMEPIQASDMTGGEPGFKVRQLLEFSDNDYWASSTTLAWQPTENIEILGNYTYREVDIIEDGAGNPINEEGYDEPSWLINGRLTFGDSNEHKVGVLLQHTEAAERNVPFNQVGNAMFDFIFGYVDRDTEDDTFVLSYEYDSPTSDLIHIEADLSYSELYVDNYALARPVPANLAFTDTGYRTRTTKLVVKNTADFVTGRVGHSLQAGVEFARSHRTTDDVVESAPEGKETTAALFLSDEMEIGRLTLTPEFRVETQTIDGSEDRFSAGGYGEYDNVAYSAGIGALYRFDNGVSLFGSAYYGEALPIIDDLDDADYVVQEEKATEIQMGISYDGFDVFASGDALALKATAYNQHFWDMTSFLANKIGGDTWGLELEAAYSMASGFYIDANANVMRSRTQFDNGTRAWSDMAPADELRLTLGQKFGETLDLSLETVFVDEIDRGTQADGYTLYNLRATYKPQMGAFDGTEVRFGVENLSDETYQPRLSARTAPGRTFKVSLAKTF
ncbi:TonB-dependent receptor plug domain-containing protein [Pseudooceanicola sp. 200-1SW]|uniref:TonB-dependent receptor plug domain-containing protein n=1 Tax=Pseudooceanicola sp. 200-1SW TaxID=3425949 RepID=UPI003D7F4B79